LATTLFALRRVSFWHLPLRKRATSCISRPSPAPLEVHKTRPFPHVCHLFSPELLKTPHAVPPLIQLISRPIPGPTPVDSYPLLSRRASSRIFSKPAFSIYVSSLRCMSSSANVAMAHSITSLFSFFEAVDRFGVIRAVIWRSHLSRHIPPILEESSLRPESYSPFYSGSLFFFTGSIPVSVEDASTMFLPFLFPPALRVDVDR